VINTDAQPERELLSNYHLSLKERKARYRFARDMGFSAIESIHLRNKPMREIERLALAGVGIESY